MSAPTHAWCPACKEDSAIDASRRCLWCGAETTPERKRGGWSRPDLRGSRYSDAQLRALHVAHRRGRSINSLAKQTYEAVGYASRDSAAFAIGGEWKRLGLRARDRIEMVIIASTTHGRRAAGRDNGAYRRWLKQREGRYRPLCAATRRQHPRKGEPCTRPAMEGSDYCGVHDPAREQLLEARMAAMRERQPVRQMVPVAPFSAWLLARRDQLGTSGAVARSIGLDPTLTGCYARGANRQGPIEEIGRDVVERCLDADGTASFEDLYPREQLDGRAPEAVGEEPQASQSGGAGSIPAPRLEAA